MSNNNAFSWNQTNPAVQTVQQDLSCIPIDGIRSNIPITIENVDKYTKKKLSTRIFRGDTLNVAGGGMLTVLEQKEDEEKLSKIDKNKIKADIDKNSIKKEKRPLMKITDTILYPFSGKDIKERSIVSVTNNAKGWQSVYDKRLGCIERDKMCMVCKENIHGCGGHDGYIQLAVPFISPVFKKSVQYIMTLVCHYCGRLFMTKDYFENSGLKKFTGEKRLAELVKASGKLDQYTQNSCSKNPTKIEQVSGFMLKLIYDDTNNNSFMTIENIILLLKNLNEEELYILGFSGDVHPLNFIITNLVVMRKQMRPTSYIDGVGSDDRYTLLYNKIINANNALIVHYSEKSKESDEFASISLEYALYSHIETLMMGGDKKQNNKSEKNPGIIDSMGGKEGLFRFSCMGKRVNNSGRTVFGPGPDARKGQILVPEIWKEKLPVKEGVTIYNVDHMNVRLKEGKIRSIIYSDKSENQIFEITRKLREEGVIKVGYTVYRNMEKGDMGLVNRQPSLQAESIIGVSAKFHKGLTLKINHTDAGSMNADFDGDEGNFHVLQDSFAKVEAMTVLNGKFHTMSGQSSKVIMGMSYNGILGMFLAMYMFPMYIYYENEFSDDEKIDIFNKFNIRPNNVKDLMSHGLPDNLTKENTDEDDNVTNKIKNGKIVHGNVTDKEYTSMGGSSKIKDWISENIVRFSFPKERFERCLGVVKDSIRKRTLFDRAKKVGLTKMYTGNILLSVCLPVDMNATFGSVVIRRGIFIKGTLSKSNIGNGKSTIYHVLKKMYSVIETNRFISEGAAIAEWIVNWHNMSIGYDAIYADRENIIKEIKHKNYEAQVDIFNLGQKPKYDDIRYVFWQKNVIEILANTEMFGKSIGEKHLKVNNTLLVASTEMSGMKGSLLNIAQITGSLGNQMIKGSLQTHEFNGGTRLAPFFVPGSVGSDNIGNNIHSFLDGLSPSEMFKHLAAARDGLVDTARSTSNIGYTHRRLSKGLETITIDYMGRCVSNDGRIFRFTCGDYFNSSEKIFTKDEENGEILNFTDIDLVLEQLNEEYEQEWADSQ